MRDCTQESKNVECKTAQQAPVHTIQESEAEGELAFFLYSSGKPHVQHSNRPLWGKAASQQLDT